MFKRLLLGSLLSCMVVGQSFGMNTNQKLVAAGIAGAGMLAITGLAAEAGGLVGGVVDCSSEGAALGALGSISYLTINTLNPEIIEFQRRFCIGQLGYSQAEAADAIQVANTAILVIGSATSVVVSGGYLAKIAHDCIIS